MKDELTKHEREVLLYIIRYKEVNGYSPTVREIANGCYRSRTTIQPIIDKLQDKGYITRKEKAQRTIRVIKFIS